MLKNRGRFVVAALALVVAFVLSIKYSDRGFEFDVRNTPVVASESGKNQTSKLEILSKVLLQIKDNYVDPSRINPAKMMVYGLDEIQNSIAEVVVDFDKPKDDGPKNVTIHANGKKKKFNLENVSSLWEMKLRLAEVFGFIQKNLKDNPDIKFNEVEYAIINGMLGTLDPHSNLLPPRNYEEMQTQTGGKFGGLGIVISIRDGQLTVISPIDGTPASRKGIKARDQIVRIGDVSTINMNLTEAVGMMRGQAGSPIDLWVLRKGWNEARKYTIVRAEIKIDSVDSQPLGDKIGYVRIKNFQANTYSDLKKHLGKVKEKMGGMQGLVLDMRDNPGGLLDQAIKVSDLFLNDGIIVSTVGVGNRLREKRSAKSRGTEEMYPIIVLLSAGSASASEIVAGAIQNHDRGIVLGDRSFGKGSVQVLYDFNDKSALKLTIAQYLTPGGISIQGRGIAPDIKVLPVGIEKDNIDLFLSKRIREGDLGQALTNNASAAGKNKFQFIQYYEKPSKDKKDGYDDGKFKEDYEIKLAQRLLTKSVNVYDRKKMLSVLQDELVKVSDAEYAKVKKELGKLKVDWTRGPGVKDAKLSVKTEVTNNNSVKAGEKMVMTVSATNNGTAALSQVKAISKADSGFLDDKEFVFGSLKPGETKTWPLTIEIPKDVSSRFDLVRLNFSDAENQYAAVNEVVSVNIEGADKPKFAFSYDITDTSGDGVLSVDENVKLRVFVKNVGKRDSAETFVYLKSLAGKSIYLKKGRQKVDKILMGKTEIIEFEFDMKEAPKDKKFIELEVDVYDTTFREYTEKKFKLPFGPSLKIEKKKQLRVLTQNTAAFTGASELSGVSLDLVKGNVVEQDAIVGKWARFSTTNGRLAWFNIDSSTALSDAEASSPENAKSTIENQMFQSPSLEVSATSSITSSSSVKISGEAKDDSTVKDYYVFVYNRAKTKVNTKKLKYGRGSKSTLKIAANVSLFKGMNRIAVVARDDDGMSTTKTIYVYRK